MKNIYVSPNGNDNSSGAVQEPVRTLKKAQEISRALSGDKTIYLEEGYYFLDEPFRVDERDSNTVFKAIEGHKPVISGGKKVENWEKVSENVWRAKVSEPKIIRELYVNGTPAKRASSKKLIKPLGWYNDLDNLNTDVDGMFVDKNEVPVCDNADEIQLHYCRGWKSMTVNIEKIIPYDEKRNIIISHHATFGTVRGGHHKASQTSPFIIENAFCFMNSENDFYYNSKEEYLYYYTSKDMNKAECIVPVIEELLSIAGSNLNHKIKNITFDGIKFAHAAWYRPHKHGLIVGQANSINQLDARTHKILDNNFVPAAVRISAAERVSIKNCEFTALGAVAIGLYEGVNKSRFEGNTFYDICDSAMTVGLPHHNFEEPKLSGYNHARNKRAYASEEYRGDEAIRAISGNLNIGWFTDMPNQWWELDLGKNIDFDRIELVSRLDQDQWDSRHSFSILASKEETPDKYDVLFKAGEEEAFDYRSTLVLSFDEHKNYRYIRIKRDIQHYFYINEVRVIDTDMEYVPFKEVCRDNIIANNAITRVGQYNYAAPAITAYYTE